MRVRRERNPLRALLQRADAADDAAFLAHVAKCRAIALVLWQDCYDRLCAEKGEAVMEAYAAWKRLRPFMHFFASEGVLHMDCPRGVCKRARRCACDSMRCVRHEALTSAEEAKARADYGDFLALMRAPETEEEQRLNGKTPSDIRAGGAKPFNASRNARESNPTRGLSPANQIQ